MHALQRLPNELYTCPNDALHRLPLYYQRESYRLTQLPFHLLVPVLRVAANMSAGRAFACSLFPKSDFIIFVPSCGVL